MSHAHGTYLGGIRTVECLRQRSRVDPVTGCWHWGLSLTRGVPILHCVTPDDGRRIKLRGRRAALYLQRGKDLAKGQIAFARMCCESDDCVNPEHSRSGNKKAFMAWLVASGRFIKGKTSNANAAAWDKRGRTLTPDMVREIRSTDESTYALAQRFGVSQCAVWLARRGKTHRHVLVGMKVASAFDWRGQIAVNDDEARAA
jgi:hypothetical protein